MKCVQVPERTQFSEDASDFLNSFIVDDLAKVALAVEKGDYGAALGAYLRGGEDSAGVNRKDVVKELEAVYEGVAPTLVPPGRWPADIGHALSLSQQFAVNRVMADLADGEGLFSVNGPPGTGKTTMLRDLVAAIVVERARRLADLPTTGSAFGQAFRWKTGERTRVVSAWTPRLTGFEIVVASANNSAVDNVSLETPRKSEIAAEWRDQADYFGEVATRVLATSLKDTTAKAGARGGNRPVDPYGRPSDPESDKPEVAWGLLAARLGNKKNRQRFMKAFWYPDKDSGAPGMLDLLKTMRTSSVSWREAVKEFRKAERAVQTLMQERAAVYAHLRALPDAEKDHDRHQQMVLQTQRRLEEVRQQIAEATRPVSALTQAVTDGERQRREHLAYKPGAVETLLSRSRLREWQGEDSRLADTVVQARQRLHEAQNVVEHLRVAEANTRRAANDRQAWLATLTRQAASARAAIAEAKNRLPDALPAADWWRDEDVRELSAPWTDPAWNAARTRLFIAALDLHRAFLSAEADRMRKNLQGAMDVLQGLVPSEVSPEAVLAAWQALFLLVPVVSTTFASVGRLFGRLGREALAGWRSTRPAKPRRRARSEPCGAASGR